MIPGQERMESAIRIGLIVLPRLAGRFDGSAEQDPGVETAPQPIDLFLIFRRFQAAGRVKDMGTRGKKREGFLDDLLLQGAQ